MSQEITIPLPLWDDVPGYVYLKTPKIRSLPTRNPGTPPPRNPIYHTNSLHTRIGGKIHQEIPKKPALHHIVQTLRMWLEVMENQRKIKTLTPTLLAPHLIESIAFAQNNYHQVKKAVVGILSTQTIGNISTYKAIASLSNTSLQRKHALLKQLPAAQLQRIKIIDGTHTIRFIAQLAFGDKIRSLSGALSIITIYQRSGLHEYHLHEMSHNRWAITNITLV